MSWIVFSYSLSSGVASSSRVGLWRRLQRLGAIGVKNGLYVLPDREDCMESFQWLAQEVQQAKGDAMVMRVERFEGMADSELIEHFRTASQEKYEKIEAEVHALEKSLRSKAKAANVGYVKKTLEKLYRQYAEVNRRDFFDSPYGLKVKSELQRVEQGLSPSKPSAQMLASTEIDSYRDRHWVTRPRPHVDRLACAWLIRRFINAKAEIRYSNQPRPNEVGFDMRGGEFGHEGNLCAFELMMVRFGFSDPALQTIAEIVHEIDLRDGRYARPEAVGIDAILKGWRHEGLSDQELESHGIALFQGLYAALS